MKNFNLKIFSKNKCALKYFFIHLFNRKNVKQNFKIIKKWQNLNTKTKVITLLKAPHVYKVSQEQFEYKTFRKKFNLLITNYRKFFILLKKIKKNRFSDIKTKLTFKIQNLNNYLLKNFLINNLDYFITDNFLIKIKNKLFFIRYKHNEKKKLKKLLNVKIKTTSKFLKILDLLGEKILNSNTHIKKFR